MAASSPPTAGFTRTPACRRWSKQTVDRLVAASERPDLKYKVTILNSPAINAFALPNGQLYITRGLIALANDKAELASVLAHEMGHVIARHAAIREEQAKQVAVISHVVNDVLSDPQTGALALAKSKLTLAAFSRAQEFEADGIGVGISARAGFDPFGASRFLTDMQRNADLKTPGGGADPRAADFLSGHPATPERVKNALANARQYSSPGSGERDRADYVETLDGMVYGEDPSEGFARGRRFTHPKLGFTFMAPPDFSLDNTAQAVLGIKEGGDEALRLDVVSVPAEQALTDYLKSGWMENIDAGQRRSHHHQRLRRGHRHRDRRELVVPPLRRALRQRRLPLHLRGEKQDAAGRPRVPRVGVDIPPHEPEGKRAGASAAPEGRVGPRQATRSRSWPRAWRCPTTSSSASACSMGWQRPTRSSRARRLRSWWSNLCRPGRALLRDCFR